MSHWSWCYNAVVKVTAFGSRVAVLCKTSAFAGEVAMSKEEVLEWCREWAKDKEYVTLGQNCWHMVYAFLSTHEGCEISESLQCVSPTVRLHPKTVLRAVMSTRLSLQKDA